MKLKRLHDRARLPEHTGVNRCLPCTGVNLGIAAAVSAVLALVSIRTAVVAFALCAFVIYLRGYLVPGTPMLTRTYLPDRVLQWFDKDSMDSSTVQADVESELDVEAVFLGVGALKESANLGDLVLTPTFKEAWYRQIDRLDQPTTKQMLADMLGVSESQLSMQEYAPAYALIADGVQIGRWESEAAFRADIAAGLALAERIEGWNDLTVEQQTGLMRGLRVFLEQCPDCGGQVAMAEETVESCCSSMEVLASTCQDCDVRLFEMNTSRIEKEGS